MQSKGPKVVFPDTGIYTKVLREAERRGNLIGAPKWQNQEVVRSEKNENDGFHYQDWRNW